MIRQPRIDEIFEHNRAAFHTRFRDRAIEDRTLRRTDYSPATSGVRA